MKQLALVLAATVALGLPARAWAQAAGVDWADVHCSASRIWPTMGLHCRATSALTNDALSTGQGMFRFWNAAGTVKDVKYYYYVAEAVHPTWALATKHDLVDALRARSLEARGSISMSDVHQHDDADYVSFTSAAREACVGIRKNGPTNPQGTRWVLYATRCVPPGEPITDRDIDRFVRDSRLRE
jgi:hypothetical protein